MVAISLYRGNLHRVSDVPRRWPMPRQSISIRRFKLLLSTRSKSLSRLHNPTNPNPPAVTDAVPNSDAKPLAGTGGEKEEGVGDNGCCPKQLNPQFSLTGTARNSGDGGGSAQKGVEQEEEEKGVSESPFVKSADSENARGAEGDAGGHEMGDVKMEASSLDKEERKKELEKSLHILNEKKHHLVQMLKQILNAEEEMKRRINMQSPVIRPSVQAENTGDAGCIAKLIAPKLSVDVNFGGDLGGESEYSNHNPPARHLHSIPCTSPSAASPLSRTTYGAAQHNTAFCNPQASALLTGNAQTTSYMLSGSITASPSPRLTPANQGHPANLPPPASVTGTHFAASSPSPAASGGMSSVFKDSRLASPW